MTSRLSILFFSIFPLLLSGCGTGPDDGETAFSRLWPNTDGSRWTYRFEDYAAADSTIQALAGLDPDEAASLDYRAIERRLDLPLPARATGGYSQKGELRIEFDGTVSTLDGPKQNLKAVFMQAGKSGFSSGVDPIAARIFRARPDLREKMKGAGLVPSGFGKTEDSWGGGPVNMWGGHFEKQEEWMGYYGDITADSSYTIARAPVRAGASFRHPLGSGLADDMWEYGWIGDLREVETAAGSFTAREVFYFIDLGTSQVITETGEVIDTVRSFSILTTLFAPGVGPVYEREIADFGGPSLPIVCFEAELESFRIAR
jgi:hypothetical protein